MVKVKGIYLNYKLYWIKVRIPKAIQHCYGKKQTLSRSLKTSDYSVAVKRAIETLREWSKEFERQSRGELIVPSEASIDALRKAYPDPEIFIDIAQERGLALALKKTNRDENLAWAMYDEELKTNEYLNPVERAYLIDSGYLQQERSLFDSLRIYLMTREGGGDKVAKDSKIAIQSLVDSLGEDIPISKLTRKHIREWIDRAIKKGNKTATVKRRWNSIRAILKRAVQELEIDIDIGRVIDDISIPSLGRDSVKRYSPNTIELKELLLVFKNDPLMTLVILCGARIGEIAGLKKDDIYLKTDTPYIVIRENEVRSVKTKGSNREFPLVGRALTAAKELMKVASKESEGLLCHYYREGGASALSAALNKRLKSKGFEKVTTHSFRHAMKDLWLREANQPEHLVNELQGHGTQDTPRTYGYGTAREMKADVLKRSYRLIGAHK